MAEQLCVVIAEDNHVLRGVLVDYLAAFGISSIEALTESEILLPIKLGQADVVVLDLVLHGSWLMLPFLQRMRQDSALQDFPVIVTTAFDIGGLYLTEQADYLAGCAILQKPYDLCQLRSLIIQLTKDRRPRVETSGSAEPHLRLNFCL